MKAPAFSTVKDNYAKLWSGMVTDPANVSRAALVARAIILHRSEYEAVTAQFHGMPWWFVGLIHYREANFNFHCHLANGDPLTHKTTHVPKGLIPDVDPPYTWEQAAVAALKHEGLDKVTDWSLPSICYRLEAYNGWGYWFRHVTSSYLWAGSNQHARGKFDGDDEYDKNLIDEQLGCMVVFKALQAILLPSKKPVIPSPMPTLLQRVMAWFHPSSWSFGLN